ASQHHPPHHPHHPPRPPAPPHPPDQQSPPFDRPAAAPPPDPRPPDDLGHLLRLGLRLGVGGNEEPQCQQREQIDQSHPEQEDEVALDRNAETEPHEQEHDGHLKEAEEEVGPD